MATMSMRPEQSHVVPSSISSPPIEDAPSISSTDTSIPIRTTISTSSSSSSAHPSLLRSRLSHHSSGSASPPSPSLHLDLNPSDTTRRINYRPTPLPIDHIANQPGSPRTTGMYRLTPAGQARLAESSGDSRGGDGARSGSEGSEAVGSGSGRHARWLSQDEGMGGNAGVGLGRAGPSGYGSSTGNASGGLGLAVASGPGSGSASKRPIMPRPPSETMHRRARGIRTGGDATTSSSSRTPSSESYAGDRPIATGTKPQDRKTAITRQRLRRVHSSEAPHAGSHTMHRTSSPTPSATLTIGSSSDTLEEMNVPAVSRSTIDMDLNLGIGSSGHPIAPPGGLPLPSIQDLVPPPRARLPLPGGVPAGGLRRAGSVADVEGAAVAFKMGSDFGSEIGIPHVREMGEMGEMSEKEEEEKSRRELVAKLMGVLGCPVCPKDVPSAHSALQQPVTLFCGHTISASHITLPKVPHPDLTGMTTLDAEHALVAFQNSKLAAWRNVTCPIPICRMHVPLPTGARLESAGLRRGVGESGFPFFAEGPGEAVVGGQLLDVSVYKVLDLMAREKRSQVAEDTRRLVATSNFEPEQGTMTDDEEGSSGHEADGEEDDIDQAIGEDTSAHSAAESSHAQMRGLSRAVAGVLVRNVSKRRRKRSSMIKLDRSPPNKRIAHPASEHGAIGGEQAKMTFERELTTIVECDVCTLLLYDPVTTPCQHTFCAKCLARSLDHSTRCPVCRQELPSFAYFQNHSVNKLMLTVILTAFPMEYAERRRGLEAEERDARLNTPIFVCTLAFPGMPTILHVFEPRYRLMLRRCIESTNPQFGMVMPARGNGSATSGLMEYGTMLEIKSIQMLPDGRSMVETMGVSRFRLREKGTLDGYTVGRVDMIEDISPEDEIALERTSIESARATAEMRRSGLSPAPSAPLSGSSSSGGPSARPLPARLQSAGAVPTAIGGDPSGETEPSTQELMDVCHAFIEQLRSGSAPWLLQRLNNMYGPMPDSPADFSYWMALVLPIDEYEKARLLPIRSPRLRLRLIVHWVEQLRSSWWFSSGCVTN